MDNERVNIEFSDVGNDNSGIASPDYRTSEPEAIYAVQPRKPGFQIENRVRKRHGR
jgi:hypothetical protein